MSEKLNVMTPSMDAFTLSKVKFLKGGGLDVHYEVTEVIDGENYKNKYHVECAKDIHPDLLSLFDQLTPIMARVFGFTSFLSMVETNEFAATEAQRNKARDFACEMLQNLHVCGLSLSGDSENIGCVLQGLLDVGNGVTTKINTPKLKFSNEVYLFLFEGKKAQLELFGQDEE